MAEELVGNVLVGQSGGPTAVINASIEGVVAEALNHACIEEIYGTLNGVLGILNEEFIDLASESQQTIRGLRHTPGAALGTCRYKLKKREDFERVLEVFKAHNIRYFFSRAATTRRIRPTRFPSSPKSRVTRCVSSACRRPSITTW